MKNKRGCGRIDPHLAHYWRGGRRWDEVMGRWIKPVYWCKGEFVIEGGQRAHGKH